MNDAVALQKAAEAFWKREDVKTELSEHAARYHRGISAATCFNARIAEGRYPGFDPPEGFTISPVAAGRQIRTLQLEHQEQLENGRQLPVSNLARLRGVAPKAEPRERFKPLSPEESVFAFQPEPENRCSWSEGKPGTSTHQPCTSRKNRGSPFCEKHGKEAHKPNERQGRKSKVNPVDKVFSSL